MGALQNIISVFSKLKSQHMLEIHFFKCLCYKRLNIQLQDLCLRPVKRLGCPFTKLFKC